MSLERELARELQAAGFLVCCVQDLRRPYDDGSESILIRYVDRQELCLPTVRAIAVMLGTSRRARGSEAAAALLRAYWRHPEATEDHRFTVAQGIAGTATKRELPQVLEILRDPTQGFLPRHYLAVSAVPRLMGKTALGLWRELLDDPDSNMRGEAVLRLCRLKDLASLARMRQIAPEVEKVAMRKSVAAALRKFEETAS